MAYRRTYTIDSLERMPGGGVLVGIAVRDSDKPIWIDLHPRDWGGDEAAFEDLVLIAVTWTLRLLNRRAAGLVPEAVPDLVPELATAG